MKQFLLLAIILLIASTFSFSQDECTLPEITEVTGAGTYCPGDEVTLTVSGVLNDAEKWEWYTGACGEDAIEDDDDDDTNITVFVEETMTYYLRAVGGCVDDPDAGGVEGGLECEEITVTLDDEPPLVECPPDMEVEAEEGVCEAVVTFKDPTGTDNCSEEVTVEQIAGPDSGSSLPVGVTTVSYSIKDALGNETICSFDITVLDTQDPVITCAKDIEMDNDPGECGAVVTYDKPTFSDNCPDAVLVRTEGPASGSLFPVGTTMVTFTVTDATGNTSSCSFSVTVNDVEPPIILLNDKKQSEWPPNHKPFELSIDDYIVTVTDNCPGVSEEDVIIDEVSSDEPGNGKGDGNTSNDIVVGDDCRIVHLLAERQGGGNGRVYTVYLAVADAHGNIGTAEIKAEVPHDQGKKKSVIDDGPVYTVNGCDIVNEENGEENNQEMTEDETSMDALGANYLETYPNPFTNSFEIWFRPQSNDRVTVDLYSFTGAKIKEIYRGDVRTDRKYSWIYNSGNLRDELYLIVITGKESYAFKRIIRK